MNRDTTFVGSNPNIGDYNLLVLLGHDGAKALRDRSLSFLTSVCDKIGMEISKIRNFRDRSEGEWEMSPNDVRCVGTGYRGHPYVFNLILSEALANKLVSGDRDAKVEIGLVLRNVHGVRGGGGLPAGLDAQPLEDRVRAPGARLRRRACKA